MQQDSFNEAIKDQALESPMDVGRTKIRRRFTAMVRTINCSILVDSTQRGAFETFWGDTLKAGTLPFTWVLPVTQVAANFQFRNPAPQYSSIGGANCRVSFVLEVIP